MEDTKNDPNLGSTTRKRKILKKCKEVMVSLNGVCQKYEESILSALGNRGKSGTSYRMLLT